MIFTTIISQKKKKIVLKFYPYINCIKKNNASQLIGKEKYILPSNSQYVPSNKGVWVTKSYTGAWQCVWWWFCVIFLTRRDLVSTTGGASSTLWKLEPNGDNKRTREENSTRLLYSRS